MATKQELADAFLCIAEDLGFPANVGVDPQEIIDEIGRMRWIRPMLDCRAGKLLRKHKPFIVVACDELYYPAVYDLIRRHERQSGRWTEGDEEIFLEAMASATEAQLEYSQRLVDNGWAVTELPASNPEAQTSDLKPDEGH